MNVREKTKALKKQAMPEVEALVKRYSRKVISGCIARIIAKEKLAKHISYLKKEAAALEKKL